MHLLFTVRFAVTREIGLPPRDYLVHLIGLLLLLRFLGIPW